MRLRSFTVLFILILSTRLVYAQDAAMPPPIVIPQENTPTELWAPPASLRENWDWVRLSSDEWLKGEIISLYNEVLEFESDELDTLELDWDDIAEIISPTPLRVRLDHGGVVEGEIHLKDGQLTFLHLPMREISKSEIVAIAPARASELELWSGHFTVGLNYRGGNSREKKIATDIALNRLKAVSRIGIAYIGNSNETDGETTENNHRLTGAVDWFFSTRTFWRVINAEYFRDPFQNISSRNTVSTSLRYQIFDRSNFSWEVTGGPGYQWTEYEQVADDGNKTDATGVGQFGTDIDWDITDRIEYEFGYNLQVVSQESGRFLHHLRTGLSIDLTDNLDLDVTYYLDRTEDPIETEPGVTPDKNDERLVIGISYDF